MLNLMGIDTILILTIGLLIFGKTVPDLARAVRRGRLIGLVLGLDEAQVEGVRSREAARKRGRRLVMSPRQSSVRCALCHGTFLVGWTCPGCRTKVHDDCRTNIRRCPTLGCTRR